MRVCVATLAAISLMLTFTGCGSASGDDVVYLHVVHGYAGGGAVTVFGPSGTVADGINFGESAGPIAFDRSTYQGQMSLKLEGLPGLVDKSIDLYALYPGEHATILLQRRISLTDLEINVLRHHQLTIDPAAPPEFSCAFEISNSLSLTNAFSDNRYEFMTEWFLSEAQYQAFYDSALESFVDTECGPLPLNDIVGIGPQILATRAQVYDEIQAQPWFFPVQSQQTGQELLLSFVKGSFVGAGGQVVGYRPTIEYKECLAQAIQIEQDPNAMMMGDSQCATENDGSSSVPKDAMGRPLVTVDAIAINDCLNRIGYSGESQMPATPETSTIFYYNPDPASGGSCKQRMRLRTHSVDAIFDPPVRSGGKLVQIDLNMPKGTWQHVIIYGRPVAPLVYMFTSDDVENGLAEDWTTPEYPNNTQPPPAGTARAQALNSGL